MIISQYIPILNHFVVHLKLIMPDVNYASIKKKKKRQIIRDLGLDLV